MAAFLDICRFLPTAGGTTDWTYAAVVQGYQSPATAGAINGRLYKYRAESSDLTQWEVGEGAYNASTGSLARTTVLFSSAGTTSKVNFTSAPQVAIVALKEDLISVEEANSFTTTQQAQARTNLSAAKTPGSWTRTVITSGSGTYTTPAGCKAINICMVGGGGGGGAGGAGSASNNGVTGTATTFGSLTAGAGGGGAFNGGGGAGGVSSGGDLNITGGFGGNGTFLANGSGGIGGSSRFGGGGANGTSAVAAGAAITNSGGGGGGGVSTSTSSSGGGGGAGGYVEKLIVSPSATYAYSVGAAGSAGVGGSQNGASGASGIIIIDEYY
jgi:hypothetical protein